jgi:hypothetical protein
VSAFGQPGHNRRLYKRLEADAETGGKEWQAHVDSLVEMVSRDLAPMSRLIGRESHNGSMDSRKRNAAGGTRPRTGTSMTEVVDFLCPKCASRYKFVRVRLEQGFQAD